VNFGIVELRDNEMVLKKLSRDIQKEENRQISTIPENIVDIFKHLPLPSLHNALEIMLYYFTNGSMVVSIEEYMYRLLGDELSDSEISKIMHLFNRHDVDLLLKRMINSIKMESGVKYIFIGWLIDKSNYNFYSSYDFLISKDIYRIG